MLTGLAIVGNYSAPQSPKGEVVVHELSLMKFFKSLTYYPL